MKKTILTLLTGILAGVSAEATAFTWYDLDTPSATLAPGQSYTGFFNLTAVGDDGDGQNSLNKFDPLAHSVTGAEVGFNFARVSPGGLIKASSISYTLDGADLHMGSFARATYAITDSVNLLFDLQTDGVLKYVIKNTGSLTTLRLDSARLDAEGFSVPDGGSTLGLFAGALVGMDALRRRK